MEQTVFDGILPRVWRRKNEWPAGVLRQEAKLARYVKLQMTWTQRAKAGVDAKHFQEALKAKS
jgi:hypothetical protein